MDNTQPPGDPAPAEPPPIPAPFPRPHPARQWAFTVVFAVCIAHLTSALWMPVAVRLTGTKRGNTDAGANAADLAAMQFQAKLLIGLNHAIASASDAKLSGLKDSLQSLSEQVKEMDTGRLPLFALELQMILHHQMEWAEGDRIENQVRGAQLHWTDTDAFEKDDAIRVDELIRRVYLEKQPLSGEDRAFLAEKIGFFGELAALHDLKTRNLSEAGALESKINAEAETLFRRMTRVVSILMTSGLIGLAVLTAFTMNLLKGKLQPRLGGGRMPPYLAFEAFTIYLLMMILLPALGEKAHDSLRIPPLTLTLLLECVPVSAAAYPLLHAFKSPEGLKRLSLPHLFSDLGMVRGEGRPREAVIGILSYVAMLPLLAVAVLITLTIARAAGIEESEGMHPIVPILTKGKDSPATVIAIFFLAVVLAPMIEEVMFRGFFYRFLRYHNDAPNSIFISAALFAGIHPQGMLGFFPLLAIGVALATLREWRNSLVAPMVLHACVNGVTLAGLLLMF